MDGIRKLNSREKMEEAFKVWAFAWQIYHGTKTKKLDYSQIKDNLKITEKDMGEFTFRFSITPVEREKLSFHNVLVTTGAYINAFNRYLEEIYPNKKERDDPTQTIDLIAARVIIFQIRNAFAHDPVEPTWRVNNTKHQKLFTINEINLQIDLKSLNKNNFKFEDVKGISGLANVLQYCIDKTSENKT